jgi:hypothetical protein
MRLARQKADGSFEYDGELYRLEDRERDHFAVRRIRDDAIVGGLRFVNDKHEARTEPDGASAEADVVRAIGRILDRALGLLPLQ